jgi:hypothetical protein
LKTLLEEQLRYCKYTKLAGGIQDLFSKGDKFPYKAPGDQVRIAGFITAHELKRSENMRSNFSPFPLESVSTSQEYGEPIGGGALP